jgi:superfamily II DNA helicase RecQ
MALSGSATPEVQGMICQELGMDNPLVIEGSLDRPNVKLCLFQGKLEKVSQQAQTNPPNFLLMILLFDQNQLG